MGFGFKQLKEEEKKDLSYVNYTRLNAVNVGEEETSDSGQQKK